VANAPKGVLEAADAWLAVAHVPTTSTLLAHGAGYVAIAAGVVWTFWPGAELLARGKRALRKARGTVSFVPDRQRSILYYVEQEEQTQISVHGYVTNTTGGPLRFLVSELRAGRQVAPALGLFAERRSSTYASDFAVRPGATANYTATGFFRGKLGDKQKVTLMLTDQHAQVHKFAFNGLTRT
jgi:hypothetical protein